MLTCDKQQKIALTFGPTEALMVRTLVYSSQAVEEEWFVVEASKGGQRSPTGSLTIRGSYFCLAVRTVEVDTE
jgi:hypothetical protein